MNFLKIGKTFINTDRVTCVRDLSLDGVPGGPGSNLIRIEFEQGHYVEVINQYDAVLTWLDENAQSISDVTP